MDTQLQSSTTRMAKFGSRRNLKGLITPSSSSAPSSYHHVIIDGDDGDKDYGKAASAIGSIVLVRDRYKDIDKGVQEDQADALPLPPVEEIEVNMVDGIFQFTNMHTEVVPFKQYMEDINKVYGGIENGPCLSAARSRLQTLEEKFELFSLLNTELEQELDGLRGGGGVFANCVKVDSLVNLSTCMDPPTLQKHVIECSFEYPSAVIGFHNEGTKDAPVTLRDILESGNVANPEHITVEGLGLHPPLQRKRFHQFDVFDPRSNPAGEFSSKLLKVFLSREGPNEGKFFASLVRPVLSKREFQRLHPQATEYKLTLKGKALNEWFQLAAWVHTHALNDFSMNTWVLSIPRRDKDRDSFECNNHEDQLRNIFYPMFLATLFPNDPDYLNVAEVLKKTSALNINSDETDRLTNFLTEPRPPATIPWTEKVNDYYFFYYCWANLCTLNALRQRLGLNTINFVPTCRDTAHFDQLVCSYLLADNVHSAINLIKCWLLQFLFMMAQIGIIMSPLSNNTILKAYYENPFPTFFKRGLRVTLGTDEPLHYHHSPDALNEEYGTAMKIFRLTAMDVCELARTSVMISNFPHEKKCEWLGVNYLNGSEGNDFSKTNLSTFRLQFRHECLLHEQTVLNLMLSQNMKSPIVIGRMKTRRHHAGIEDLHELRNPLRGRRVNYIDRRIVYPRIDIFHGSSTQYQAYKDAGEPLRKVLNLRKKYVNPKTYLEGHEVNVNVEDVFVQHTRDDTTVYESYYGVFVPSRRGTQPEWASYLPPIATFMEDLNYVRNAVTANSDLVPLAAHRLNLLEHKFLLHLAMNVSREAGKKETKELNNRDFFTAHKVDVNVHTDSGMNARTLLDFFVEKATHNGHDVVMERDQSPVTLRQFLSELGINVTQITVDELLHLLSTNADIREIFLDPDNFMQGRYFAELSKRTLELYKLDAYTFSENRLVVQGRNIEEWNNLALWFDRYGMASSQNRWIVCFKRSYRKLKQNGEVESFADFLDNIFGPLWEVSLHPRENTKFHYFLSHVSGFDCVDDESKVDLPMEDTYPHDWRSAHNPPYNYYMYYLWANIASLNNFRASRGLGTFSFRPQCGEHGGIDHLLGGFLAATSINHGLTLAKFPALEYAYYIAQIGIAMSPLSNTQAASAYLQNPFPLFFHRGHRVTLSTNQPLYFHFTREPLVEEYSIAAKLWSLRFNDLSEIARNSVLQCGFPRAWKEHALGKLYTLNSTLGNDVVRSRVSDIRIAYRFEVYHTELNYLDQLLPTGQSLPRAMLRLEEEAKVYNQVTGKEVDLLKGDGDDDEEVVDTTEKLHRLQLEVDKTKRRVHKAQMTEQQLVGENHHLSSSIVELQNRLKSEAMRISGNLNE